MNNRGGARTLMLTDDDTVQGDGFVMKFSPTGVRLPSSLVHGDTEVFAASTCPNPSRVGVSIEPFETAVGGRLPVGFDSTRNFTEVKLRGPAVAQIAVTYDVPYSCAGPQSLRGTSTFTMFPSGRIVRNDVVQASTGAMIDDAIMCTATCDGSQRDATLDVFWAFAGGGDLYEVTAGGDVSIPKGNTATVQFACAQYPTHTVAVDWSTATPAWRTVDTGSIVFAYDLFVSSPAVDQALQVASSTVLVAPGAETCTDMEPKTKLLDRLVLHDGTAHELVLDGTGIYTGTGAYDGRFEIRPPAGMEVRDGFAVQLDLGTSDHLSVARRTGGEVKYAVQPAGAQTIIWIEDGIPDGDAIIIEAF